MWPGERTGSVGFQELKSRPGWAERTAPVRDRLQSPGGKGSGEREETDRRGSGRAGLFPGHFSRL